MLQAFYPGEYLESVYRIDFEQLYKEGYRGVIFDIDNTLVPHGAPADARAEAFFARLKKLGFQCCLLSNNKEPRVKLFNQNIRVHAVFRAHKPRTGSYLKAMELMGTKKSSTLFVGDQIFTDIWGANRTGIRTMLVKPINPKEEIQIVLKRYPEKLILFFYQRRRRRNKTDENNNRK